MARFRGDKKPHYDAVDYELMLARVSRTRPVKPTFHTVFRQQMDAHAARLACPKAFLPDSGIPYRVLMLRLLRGKQ